MRLQIWLSAWLVGFSFAFDVVPTVAIGRGLASQTEVTILSVLLILCRERSKSKDRTSIRISRRLMCCCSHSYASIANSAPEMKSHPFSRLADFKVWTTCLDLTCGFFPNEAHQVLPGALIRGRFRWQSKLTFPCWF